MTDRDDLSLPEATPLEELASALLDGEATPEEQARAGEPEVVAGVERFAAIAAVVGTEPEPPSAGQRDAAVAAALAALAPVAPVDELARRRHRWAGTYRLVGAAAAVVAVIGLGALVASRSVDDDDTTASEAADAPTDDASDTTAAATLEDQAAGGADAATESGPAPSAGFDLGRYDDVDALVLDSAARAPQAPTSYDDAGGSPDASTTVGQLERAAECAPAVLSGAAPATVLTATLGERDVVVFVTSATEAARVVVVDAATCEVLADRTP